MVMMDGYGDFLDVEQTSPARWCWGNLFAQLSLALE